MFSPQVAELAYIGSRATKTDNVCGTGTVWIGFGDIQKVERKHIPVFLKHPDVWMLADKFRAQYGISEPLTGEQVGGGVQTDSASIGAAFVDGAPIVSAQVLGSEAKTDSAPEVVNVQAGLADAPIVPSPAAPEVKSESNSPAEPEVTTAEEKSEKSEKTGEQLAVIKNAILSLEQGNPKHFSTTNGVPVVSAVRNAANDENITAAEVRTAWAELNGKAE